ncbi:unnamed protein product [Adineta ricciae]|uniref:Uncharacterized protein n=1 Tax=Adineta ricciae TaxID=249248 RepID=A0A814QMP5_ADIRI|nr:unnamed protein product [Adineta ricciae]
MDSSADCQVILTTISEFYRISMSDSDEKIKTSLQTILKLWPDVLHAGNTATDDELFSLNVSRAVFTQIFAITLSKEFFNKDHLLIREIFFTLFSILTGYTHIFKENKSVYIESNVRLIIKMMTSVVSVVRFQHDDLTKPEEQNLLIAIREHIDSDDQCDSLSDGSISLIWNICDKTILIPTLLKAGYGRNILQWVEQRKTKFREEKIDAPIHILHNFLRHDDGIHELNKYNPLSIIEAVKFEPSVSDDDDYDLTIHLAMIRALLTDYDQIKQDTAKYPHKAINMLLQLSINAAKHEKCRYNGFHVSEPLTVLVKLFHNDEILHGILNKNETKPPTTIKSIIELFTTFLSKSYPKMAGDNDVLDNYTCVVIFNLFWILSNHERYHDSLRQSDTLIGLVKNAVVDPRRFVDTFMPRTMKSIYESASEILKNLDIEQH